MVYLGTVLHNCLGTLCVEQHDCSTVLYITDEEKGGEICAAIEVSLSFCRLHQAYLGYNRRIPAKSALREAIDSFMKRLETIVQKDNGEDGVIQSRGIRYEPDRDDADFLIAALEEAIQQLGLEAA